MPQDFRCSIETTVMDLLSAVGPVRFTIGAYIKVLVVPPKLEAAKGFESVVLYPENGAGIEQLFYLGLVFDTDFSHLQVLREKLSALQPAFWPSLK